MVAEVRVRGQQPQMMKSHTVSQGTGGREKGEVRQQGDMVLGDAAEGDSALSRARVSEVPCCYCRFFNSGVLVCSALHCTQTYLALFVVHSWNDVLCAFKKCVRRQVDTRKYVSRRCSPSGSHPELSSVQGNRVLQAMQVSSRVCSPYICLAVLRKHRHELPCVPPASPSSACGLLMIA